MGTVRADEFTKYDCVLDSIGLMLEGEADDPYDLVAPDNVMERQDFSTEMTENKLDDLFWGSNRSWHEGAGQARLQVPDASTPFGFESSKLVDVFSVKGQATLLHKTALLHSASYTTQRQKLCVASDKLFMVSASATLRRITAVDGTGANVTSGLAGDIKDMATDGADLYVCTGSNLYVLDNGDTTATTFSTDDVHVIEWAKDRLYAVRLNGTRYEFGYYDSAAVFTSEYLFPVNIVPNQICELGPLVYISTVTSGSDKSAIYAFDGTNAPFVALPLPDGDIVHSMTPFLGAGMLIGCRRVRETLADAGALLVAFPQGAGHLVSLEKEVVVLGDTDTTTARDYKIERGVAFGRLVFFGWPYDDASGLGVYNPETAGYARHLCQPSGTVGQIGGIARWRGRLFFTVQGVGLYGEQSTYPTEGYIISSRIDLNIDAEKTWTVQETGFKPLPAGTTVSHAMDTGAGTFPVGNESELDDNEVILRSERTSVARQVQYKVFLGSLGDNTPTIIKAGIGGAPASKRKVEHTLLIRAFSDTQLNTGERQAGDSLGWQLLDQLLDRRAAGAVLDYQPPWWRHDQTTVKVRLASVQTVGPWGVGGDRQGGLIRIVLKEVA